MVKKFIFVTGGVVSSLGKGLLSASIGMLLESQGMKIAMLKFDPYLNIDPGTMSPLQHGEIYVTEDGTETDLDLGHYYRFTQSPLSKISNITAGKIYDTIIKKERRGDYLGHTVQVIPHVTEEIKKSIHLCAMQEEGIEVTLVEIGGTVGDIESQPFMEAIRQFHLDHPGDCVNIHLAYVPYLGVAKEMKTKPMQHSVQMLRSTGLFPDLIFCRSTNPLESPVKEKISLFCSVPKNRVLEIVDVASSIYELPLHLMNQKLDQQLSSLLDLPHRNVDVSRWETLVDEIKRPKSILTVGLVGKYINHQDAYKSVSEALCHGAVAHGVQIDIRGIDVDELDQNKVDACDGYLVPGGFGKRGFEGKLQIARMCRKYHIPYFGICLGMHALVVEFSQSVLQLERANSTEIDPHTPDPVISLMSDQKHMKTLGGTMRLGAYSCMLRSPSKAFETYGEEKISERHRHRYEFNTAYQKSCEKNGLLVSGMCPENGQCEIVELCDHPWMLGVQFHPEFKSKLSDPHPLFSAFVQAMLKKRKIGKSTGY